MNVKIYPSQLNGNIEVPTSKSYSIRAIFVSLLAKDVSILHDVNLCDDVYASLDCIKEAGAYITYIYFTDRVDLIIDSRNLVESGTLLKLNCRNCATALRLSIPVFLSLGYELIVLGSQRLLKRGIEEYTNAFGLTFSQYDDVGLRIKGRLNHGVFNINTQSTSQYLSGALLASANLEGNSVINTKGKIVSKSYIDITLDVLNKAGINILYDDYSKFIINGMQIYEPLDFTIEGDESLAAYFGLLKECGMPLNVVNRNPLSLQGDKLYESLFKEMKKSCIDIDLANIIDLAPILFVAAGLFNGARFKNFERLVLKESDRIDDCLVELKKFGYNYYLKDGYLVIDKANISSPKETLNTHEDHRIVMSLAVLCLLYGGTINDIDCVDKSYPEFFNDIIKAGASIERR